MKTLWKKQMHFQSSQYRGMCGNPIGITSVISAVQNVGFVSEPSLVIYAVVMLELNTGSLRRSEILKESLYVG